MKVGSSEIQQKNEQFRNEIRQRNKDGYFKRVRSEFFKLENKSDILSSQDKLKIIDLDAFLNNPISKTNLFHMNRILTRNREIINENLFLRLIEYANANLLFQNIQNISEKNYLNDLIAFYSNLMLIDKFDPLLQSKLNFSEVTDYLLNLALSVNQVSSSHLAWLLFTITLIKPQQTILMISQAQLQLFNHIGKDNINLSYLLRNIAIQMPELIVPEIVQRYIYVEITKETQIQFCKNIVQIFSKFIENNNKHSLTDLILKWIGKQLSQSIFPIVCRDELLLVVYNLLQKRIQLTTLINLVNEGNIVSELVSRCLFDTNLTNKQHCLTSINNLINQSPQLQRQQLIKNHSSIPRALISSLQLFERELTIKSLISIAQIVLTSQNNKQIKKRMISEGICNELQSLSYSQTIQISELANSLKEEVFNY